MTAPETEVPNEAGAPEKNIRITPDMYRAGVAAFQNWKEESEEIECLVASMFYSMLEAKRR